MCNSSLWRTFARTYLRKFSNNSRSVSSFSSDSYKNYCIGTWLEHRNCLHSLRPDLTVGTKKIQYSRILHDVCTDFVLNEIHLNRTCNFLFTVTPQENPFETVFMRIVKLGIVIVSTRGRIFGILLMSIRKVSVVFVSVLRFFVRHVVHVHFSQM